MPSQHTPGPCKSHQVGRDGASDCAACVAWWRLIAQAPAMLDLLQSRPGVRLSGAEYNAMAAWQDKVDAILRAVEG